MPGKLFPGVKTSLTAVKLSLTVRLILAVEPILGEKRNSAVKGQTFVNLVLMMVPSFHCSASASHIPSSRIYGEASMVDVSFYLFIDCLRQVNRSIAILWSCYAAVNTESVRNVYFCLFDTVFRKD